MDFLKRHYEKVVLIVVLVALALAAAWLPVAIGQAKSDIENTRVHIPENPAVVPAEDLGSYRGQIQALTNPPPVEFHPHHKLFNPVTWKRKPDGGRLKSATGEEEGAAALELVRTIPLNLVISYLRYGAADRRYTFMVTREASANPNLRNPQQRRTGPGEVNDVFLLREVVGPPEEPTAFVVELVDTQEVIRFSADQPFRRAEAHMAELRYPPENRSFSNVRVGGRPLAFGGDLYRVIAITSDTVRVVASSNQKHTTLSLKKDA